MPFAAPENCDEIEAGLQSGNRNPELRARCHRMPFGAELRDDGTVRFRIFAPAAPSMRLALDDGSEPLPMASSGDGWHELVSSHARPGSLYRFLLPDGSRVPDPVSRFQPQDVHGPSEVIDPRAYPWQTSGWRGRPWSEAVLYELHVGTFTPEGTFRSAIGKLDHLAALGITAIELMCIADFAGRRNWGYDGVLFYAPDSAYGRPEDLKAFIDEAHARGLMVILDVVYNHFGPEGNFIPSYFPQLLTNRHRTPWGDALNFDGDNGQEVRSFILHNALYWIEEFHADGLRLDAAHAIMDNSPKHLLDELAERVRHLAGDRNVHLILENEHNIAKRLTRDAAGKAVAYTAQWNHDMTHLLGAAMATDWDDPDGARRQETGKLAKALAEGFVIAAQESGKETPDSRVPPTAFVAFFQTHDLVGNRIFGDRIYSIASPEATRAIASIHLLLPQIPMMFMGDEWAASTPFLYFSDYHGDLAKAVRKGRCEQISKQAPAPSQDELRRAPDPQADSTFRCSRLNWQELSHPSHAAWLDWCSRLLRTRQESIAPLLKGLTSTCGTYQVHGPGLLSVRWILLGGATLHLAANLSATPAAVTPPATGQALWSEGPVTDDGQLGPWSVRYTLSRQDEVCG